MASQIPAASIHSPNELLSHAKAFLKSNDPLLHRAALIEAITALESLVATTVFPALNSRVGKDLAEWLEKRTLMDFDTRLGLLVPLVTGHQIDKAKDPWTSYKAVKGIRNDAIHSGQRITQKQAEKAVTNVERWMEILVSTVDLSIALEKLRHWVEKQQALQIRNELDCIDLVRQFFRDTAQIKADIASEIRVDGKTHRPDLILDFGKEKVVVETKFIRDDRGIEFVIAGAKGQVEGYSGVLKGARPCVVIFTRNATDSRAPCEERGGTLSVVIAAPHSLQQSKQGSTP